MRQFCEKALSQVAKRSAKELFFGILCTLKSLPNGLSPLRFSRAYPCLARRAGFNESQLGALEHVITKFQK